MIGNKAKATLVETYVATDSAKAYQIHDTTVIWVGDESNVQHVRVMEDALDAASIASAIVTTSSTAETGPLVAGASNRK